jgi:DnaJ-class molecular chaperone
MPWGRRKRRESAEEEKPVDLDDSEHAWWAAREDLEKTYQPKPRKKRGAKAEPERSAFEEYFTAESLFAFGERATSDDGSRVLGEWERPDPYLVLGLPETSTWEQITASHRRLAKLHHPDRLLNATDEDREKSEQRMRELNIAYSELRRRRGR